MKEDLQFITNILIIGSILVAIASIFTTPTYSEVYTNPSGLLMFGGFILLFCGLLLILRMLISYRDKNPFSFFTNFLFIGGIGVATISILWIIFIILGWT